MNRLTAAVHIQAQPGVVPGAEAKRRHGPLVEMLNKLSHQWFRHHLARRGSQNTCKPGTYRVIPNLVS